MRYNGETLQSRSIKVDILKLACALERLLDLCLVVQNMPISLNSNLGEIPPTLEVFRVALVSMRLLGLLPMSFAEVEHRCDLLFLDIVYQRACCSGFFQPLFRRQPNATMLIPCGRLKRGRETRLLTLHCHNSPGRMH